jgi:hypothetical protein
MAVILASNKHPIEPTYVIRWDLKPGSFSKGRKKQAHSSTAYRRITFNFYQSTNSQWNKILPAALSLSFRPWFN